MQKDKIIISAYGKVNLGLDVTGIRNDGYHLVRMVMQTVDVSDLVTVSRTDSANAACSSISLSCSDKNVPTGENNLAYRAVDKMCRDYNIRARIHIDLEKHIPMAAGMGGGSADAAAAILGMNQLFDLNLDQDRLDKIALELGADVPFCLRRGTYLAEGIGEKLTKLPDLMHCCMVIIKPQISVSTPWAYKALDELMAEKADAFSHPDIDGIIRALQSGDINKMTSCMGNVLEEAVCRKYTEIKEIKQKLLAAGALNALMSGSGSVVFGIFADKKSADDALVGFGGEEYGKFEVEF